MTKLFEQLIVERAKNAEHEEKEGNLLALIIQYRLSADRVSNDKQLHYYLLDSAKNIEDILNGSS